jgi:16S rRNA (cytidine1402-2'-O)-methyltransferase
MGTLFLVATPIGNLEDISARALRILKDVHLIAAEDTRRTRKLLRHYDIQSELISYYDHIEIKRIDFILQSLDSGDVALVSDAGTPGLNDPGYKLVQAVIHSQHHISPIPGPCAPISALVASGLPTKTFLYLGYLPRKNKERLSFLSSVAKLPYTLIFLESPHRLLDSLEDLIEILSDRKVAVARELTKIHEEIYRGKLSDAVSHFTKQAPKGEFTIVVAGNSDDFGIWSIDEIESTLVELLANGHAPSQLVKQISQQSGWKKREVYNLVNKFISEKDKNRQ